MRLALFIIIAAGTGCAGSLTSDSQRTLVAAPQSLYNRLGGAPVLQHLVDAWLLEAASDPRIRDFFRDADISHLKLRLVERLCVLVDGPCLYRGANVAEHHARLGIEPHHLDAFLDDLSPALQRLGVDEALAKELREALVILAAQIGASQSVGGHDTRSR